ncbi:MAG TPA: hypothetical protein VK881_06710 [bacterium]|nr:hypothetical protein [bacterium]
MPASGKAIPGTVQRRIPAGFRIAIDRLRDDLEQLIKGRAKRVEQALTQFGPGPFPAGEQVGEMAAADSRARGQFGLGPVQARETRFNGGPPEHHADGIHVVRAALTRCQKRNTAGVPRKKQMKEVSSEHMDLTAPRRPAS